MRYVSDERCIIKDNEEIHGEVDPFALLICAPVKLLPFLLSLPNKSTSLHVGTVFFIIKTSFKA